ncbi:hypothetical protein BD770DRAFT_447750 [Pilaira anomala]|nr:hypothetical protein BD770DRAFT_447750 [Pilaira anomala]
MTVRLDVGGKIFRTYIDTLKESDFLSNLANGDWSEGPSGTEPIFIDRDEFLFTYILMYLRTGDFNIDKQHYENLKSEADFFLLPKMAAKIDLLIKEAKPMKTMYELLDEEKFLGISEINISSIKCLVQVYNCPRKIRSHIVAWRCGKACANARPPGDDGYKAEETTMYLVSTKY